MDTDAFTLLRLGIKMCHGTFGSFILITCVQYDIHDCIQFT